MGMTSDRDQMPPIVRKLLTAWPLILALCVVLGDGVRIEWSIADHERRLERIESQMLPLSNTLSKIEQQNDDIVDRLVRIERRQDQEKPQ
jgi:Tfp pilus assembly protein PilN